MRSSRTSRRAVLAAGVGLLALPAVPAIATSRGGGMADGANRASTLAVPGSTVFARTGDDTFRIPAVVRAANGDLLAFAERRIGDPDDFGDIDMVLSRSTDDGQTWGSVQVVWDDGTNKVGNPVPVVDQASGDVVLLVIRWVNDERRPYVLRSTDNGESWSDPVEITDDVKLPEWGHFVFGPGHAIQLTRGEHAGRIVAPGNHSAADGGGVHLAYSDDGGRTWQLGAVDEDYGDDIEGNESQVVELTDGRLYQAIRDQHGSAPSNRAYAISSDGGASYDGALVPEDQLDTAVVEGSVQRVFATDEGADTDLLVFSCAKDLNPDDELTRQHMVIWRSNDEGQTWEEARTIWDGRAAYSDMIKLSDERLGLLYEGGNDSPYEEISFARVVIDNITP